MADKHSTYVAWAKVLLPLGALTLLSTTFLFARAPQIGDTSIPYADIEQLAREQQISAPSFSGVADDGSIIEILAESARPEDAAARIITVTRIHASLSSPGGMHVDVRAGEGRIDRAAGTARLGGLARIVTSDGYEIETAAVSADLDSGRIETEGALEAHAPFGELAAGKLVIETPEGGGQRLLFNEGVRLVYDPAQAEALP
ncbi:hypothetical protein [Roseisalinus antarcticus]|uniref:Lipopolysaccharide-assembly, LptC-related n=1 Tax=Roseisalinus antarcticus TaxID=254357 RepID=A0A1Y5S5T2_9RHOB|nr:hypothetical protein [Roseisalinus antarcticus]SLN33127.1 hypothetical protein ROA7023_01183 [Roseisalinus antarcticus]